MAALQTFVSGCQRTDLVVDLAALKECIFRLLNTSVFKSEAERIENTEAKAFATVNLTYPARFCKTPHDRWFKFSANHERIINAGLTEAEFDTLNPEIENTVLGQSIRQVERYHQSKFGSRFVGRYQLIWVNPKACYPLHQDFHTPHRYHIPITTNPDCWWIFRSPIDKEVSLLHMPADGGVWYLDPVQQEHTVVNLGASPRLHLLMTSTS